jgi:hypothetical protein
MIGLLLAACSESATAPVPAKPETTPSATSEATAGLVLLDISGSGNHQSNPFTAPGKWDVIWEAAPAPNIVSGGLILIDTYDTKGNPVADTIQGNLDVKKSGVVHMTRAGTVYLNIRADDGGTWHVKAVVTWRDGEEPSSCASQAALVLANSLLSEVGTAGGLGSAVLSLATITTGSLLQSHWFDGGGDQPARLDDHSLHRQRGAHDPSWPSRWSTTQSRGLPDSRLPWAG